MLSWLYNAKVRIQFFVCPIRDNIIFCEDEKPRPKPDGEESRGEGKDSSEEHGEFGKRSPPMRGKRPLFQKGDGNNNDDDGE